MKMILKALQILHHLKKINMNKIILKYSMNRITFLVIIGIISVSTLIAQNNTVNLSLQDAIKMATERNVNVKSAQIEKDKTQSIIDETYSNLYPSISVGGSFTDNLKIATMLLPGEIVGAPGTMIPVQMGVQYNMNVAASLNMILYNQTALTALKVSKKALELNDLVVEKVREELAFEVSKLYFSTLTTAQQKSILEDNITKMEQLSNIVKVSVDNGMALQIDFDRVNINIENLRTQLNNVESGLEQLLNVLKYILNIPIRNEIILTDKTDMILLANVPAMKTDFSDHVDIKLLESQRDINVLTKKITNSGYYPSLYLTGQYLVQGMNNDLSKLFSEKWFNSANIGLSFSIPIFDGFEKRSKANQNELDILKTEIQLLDKKDDFNVNYRVALNNYNNNKNNLERQKQNINLATKVYDETTLKYREGMASMSNLLQDEMSLSAAQSNFLNALYNFKEAELKIMSLNGNMKKMIGK